MLSWRSPNVDEMVLAAFVKKGLVPSKEVVHWRVPYVAGFVTICEAFVGMEPYTDSFWRVFFERALSERKTLRIAPVGGFALAAAQVGQFIKFDEISSSHGGHTLVGNVPAQELP